MTNKQRAQAHLVVEIDFKGKNAEYQIGEVRHSFDACTVPGPCLGTDLINYLLSRRLSSQRAGETQIETWIIKQDYRGRFARPNCAPRCMKLFADSTIFPEYFP